MTERTNAAIRGFLKQEAMLDRPNFELRDDTNLLDEHILDSLQIFSLIGFLEERFGVRVEPDEVVEDNFETINAIVGLVEEKETESRENAS